MTVFNGSKFTDAFDKTCIFDDLWPISNLCF